MNTVAQSMTSPPVTVQATDTVRSAVEVMVEHRVRHVPVLRGEHLVGILSQRDIFRAEGVFASDDVLARPVCEVMTMHPYKVAPATPLREVVGTMESQKIGAALVVEHGKLLGIFTGVDALRVLRRSLGA